MKKTMETQGFKIREATLNDAQELMPLVLAQYGESYTLGDFADRVFIRKLAENRIKEYFDPTNPGQVYLLQTGDHTSGIIYTLPDEEHGNWYITDFYIEEDQRGQNYGEELIKACEDFVHTQKAAALKLNVETAAPRLVEWYKKNGYLVQQFETADGKTDVDPSIKCPTHSMQKPLAPDI